MDKRKLYLLKPDLPLRSHKYFEVRMNSQAGNTVLLGLSVIGPHNSIQTTVIRHTEIEGAK